MHNINLTERQLHTIIAALDSIRSDCFEKAYHGDNRGNDALTTRYYDISQEYETIILALQAQMKGEVA